MTFGLTIIKHGMTAVRSKVSFKIWTLLQDFIYRNMMVQIVLKTNWRMFLLISLQAHRVFFLNIKQGYLPSHTNTCFLQIND